MPIYLAHPETLKDPSQAYQCKNCARWCLNCGDFPFCGLACRRNAPPEPVRLHLSDLLAGAGLAVLLVLLFVFWGRW